MTKTKLIAGTEYISMQKTLDCKWSGRKASSSPCFEIGKRTTQANNKRTNFPPVSRLSLLFGEIQSSITDLSISD